MEWEWKEINGRNYMMLPAWEKQGITAFFTSRCGGVSQPPFESLNLGLHVEDQYDAVMENRRRIAADHDIQLSDMVCAEQVHGNLVAIVTEDKRGIGTLDYRSALPGCDAMVTNREAVYLMSFYADCIPIYFFDPVRRAVGLAHSGWKGTAGRIAVHTLIAMIGAFGCDRKDIQVFLGPGIGHECYEIDRDRQAQAAQIFTFAEQVIYARENQRITWDLKKTSAMMLEEAGLLPGNITICGLCTACETERFFSYRAENGKTGRMAAVIGLAPVGGGQAG